MNGKCYVNFSCNVIGCSSCEAVFVFFVTLTVEDVDLIIVTCYWGGVYIKYTCVPAIVDLEGGHKISYRKYDFWKLAVGHLKIPQTYTFIAHF